MPVFVRATSGGNVLVDLLETAPSPCWSQEETESVEAGAALKALQLVALANPEPALLDLNVFQHDGVFIRLDLLARNQAASF